MMLRSMLMFVLLAVGATSAMAQPTQPISIARGTVESITGTLPPVLVIDGLTYTFALDAKVELGGTKFGATSMVERNMKVEYTYTTQPDERRTIVLLRQLSPDVRVLEH